jgi:hypothetical protein
MAAMESSGDDGQLAAARRACAEHDRESSAGRAAGEGDASQGIDVTWEFITGA